MLNHIQNFLIYSKTVLNSKIDLNPKFGEINNIVVAGMGGSAIPGDVAKDAFKSKLKIPIEVSRSYELPGYANENTLVVCISYSGNTRETLSQLSQALERNCKVICISSNGKISEIAKNKRIPLLEVPKDLLPREAFPYLLFSLIKVLETLKLVKLDIDFKNMEKQKNGIERKAKKMAKKINGTFPLIITKYFSVGHRFKSQLNENAKTLSKYEIYPELNHNEVESWRILSDTSIILFRTSKERTEIKKSIHVLKNILNKKAEVFEIYSKGKSDLEDILYEVWFGDFVSYFLAKEKGVNPTTNKIIKKIKAAIQT